jgi:hypothetical protein
MCQHSPKACCSTWASTDSAPSPTRPAIQSRYAVIEQMGGQLATMELLPQQGGLPMSAMTAAVSALKGLLTEPLLVATACSQAVAGTWGHLALAAVLQSLHAPDAPHMWQLLQQYDIRGMRGIRPGGCLQDSCLVEGL